MNANRLKLCRLACAGTLFLAACGGGGYGGSGTMPGMGMVTGKSFAATTLVSDVPAGNSPYSNANTDPHLVKAWGVAFNPKGFVWVTNNGTSTSTLYDGTGVPQSLVVSIPAGGTGSALPTGIVFNDHQDFMVTRGGVSGASAFIFAGQGGTLSGWSPGIDMTHAITVFDGSGAGAVYTGLAIASRGGSDMLYAADFRHATVEMFDSSFMKVTVAESFMDPAIPAGYAPFGIQAIGDLIYVSYARQDAQAFNAVAGAGLGAVDAFDTSGHLVRRVVAPGGPVDEPWGMAMAPASFGPFSNALLIANSGSGTIGAFNPVTGAFMGTLSTSTGSPITIDGLRGIAFGNGINSQPTNTLFFAAGPGDGTHGVYGRIDVR
ncbi:MAG: TIGR03118 family protein [Proteobacteria bacterium]|nr:TIGR03118 family protein [Pseudomonadota bacterium]